MADQPVAFVVLSADMFDSLVMATGVTAMPSTVDVEPSSWNPDSAKLRVPIAVYDVYPDGRLSLYATAKFPMYADYPSEGTPRWHNTSGPHQYGYDVSYHFLYPDDPYDNAPLATIPLQGTGTPRTYIGETSTWKLYPTEADRDADTNGVPVHSFDSADIALFAEQAANMDMVRQFYPYHTAPDVPTVPTVPTPPVRLPKFKASGRLTVYQPSRRPIRLPVVRAGGRMGTVAKAKLPKIKAGGALTVTTVMRAELTLPAFGVAFQMSVGPAGQAKLRLPAIRASGAMGAVAKASLPPLRARGAMTVGAAGEARLRLPRIRAKGTLTIGAVLSGTVVLPAIRTARSGMVLRIRLPAMRMVHRAAASGMAAGEAYSTNLRTDIEGGGNEMTRLTNFPFLRVLKFNDWYYGLAADGLYRIEGDRDDGSPIRWEVSTGTTDFGARELKHVPSVYVGGRLGPGAAFTVHEGEKRDASYRYSTPRGQAAQNYRQHFGKGLRARYYSFTLTGESEFELDGLHFELAASKRRL